MLTNTISDLTPSFGISSAYLTPERVKTLSNNLGGSTVVGSGLFTTFVAIAREDEIFGPKQETEKALGGLGARIAGDSNGVGTPQQRASFKTYLDTLLEKHPAKAADRLVIFVSDCDLSYNDYDFPSLMDLYAKYKVRIETICIGSTNPPLSGAVDKPFANAIKSMGGHINRVDLPDLKNDPKVLEKTLKDILDRIDKQKPRAVLASTNIEKRPMTTVFLLIALGALLLGRLLESLNWFRVNS